MQSGQNAEFVAVPGADYTGITGVKAETLGSPIQAELLFYSRDQKALADRTALVRARILVSVQRAGGATAAGELSHALVQD